jgi:dipeptidyl-peptidase 9
VQICPTNSNLICYVLNDNLWLYDLGRFREVRLTHTSEPIKSGVPSYVVQEEFDRYTGYWWQPNDQLNEDGSRTYRLIYEEIDDSIVDLTYITPSCVNEFGYDSYRYPKVGTNNSKIYLKMIEITLSKEVTLDSITSLLLALLIDSSKKYSLLGRGKHTS